eukprot:scaffold1541_cov67-Phaeocystis_antarctica.AAC.5
MFTARVGHGALPELRDSTSADASSIGSAAVPLVTAPQGGRAPPCLTFGPPHVGAQRRLGGWAIPQILEPRPGRVGLATGHPGLLGGLAPRRRAPLVVGSAVHLALDDELDHHHESRDAQPPDGTRDAPCLQDVRPVDGGAVFEGQVDRPGGRGGDANSDEQAEVRGVASEALETRSAFGLVLQAHCLGAAADEEDLGEVVVEGLHQHRRAEENGPTVLTFLELFVPRVGVGIDRVGAVPRQP